MKYNEFNLSIRYLVETVLKSGSLNGGFAAAGRLQEGTRLHQKLQKMRGSGYSAEVALAITLEYEGFIVNLEGRADGIFTEEGILYIEEIKTTDRAVDVVMNEKNELHWAQARCYAFIYCRQNGLAAAGVQLAYLNTKTEEIAVNRELLTIEELEKYLFSLLDLYLKWMQFTSGWLSDREISIKQLRFPFENYRAGQRDLVRGVYKTIEKGSKLFAQAPTGTGKTISALYPAVKAIGEGLAEKIFYLTARTTTRQVAEEAVARMLEKGLKLKAITLTAKEKLCFTSGAGCKPELCRYAEGYYDRIDNAILSALKDGNGMMKREDVEAYARRFTVCPFEFSLDLALSCDCIICDYNYLFDPRVYLKRFFMNKGSYIFLIDEAHNLVDRAREMFSAQLSKKRIQQLKMLYKNAEPGIYKRLSKLNSYFIGIRKKCMEEGRAFSVVKEEPSELYPLLKDTVGYLEPWLGDNFGAGSEDELLQLYFDMLVFLKIAEFYDERYVTYEEVAGSDVKIRLFCTDPSYLLNNASKRGKASIFFSATLTPLSYFRSILGGANDSYTMKLSSPFFSENLCLLVANRISTKYKDREGSYLEIAEYIKAMIKQKKGNYMVYFPSYKYLHEVAARFTEISPGVRTLIQASSMSEEDRELFLSRFEPEPEETLVGFGVMGGIFSEGIDLKGDRLIGAVVVGVGLPQLSLEQNIIMEHFRESNGMGFEYAYMYPGMNKVLQAAGRVIRSEEDRGVILLIDERFTQDSYQELFPDSWSHFETVADAEDVKQKVKRFWE